MKICFSRHDPTTHRLRVWRAPYGRIDSILDSRSMLLHDFTHYAVEAELETDDGFWGLLATGHGLDALREESLEDPSVTERLMAIEKQVGPLQTRFKRDPASLQGRPAGRLLRKLDGAWRKVRMGQSLVLGWPPTDPVLEDG